MTTPDQTGDIGEEPPDIHYCAIHYGHFSMNEEGGCPECMGEWEPVRPGDDDDKEEVTPDAG